MIKSILISFVMLSLTINNVNCQNPGKDLILNLSAAKKNISSFKEFKFKVSLTVSQLRDTILLHECPKYNYNDTLDIFGETDVLVRMERIEEDKYCKLKSISSDSDISCFDSTGMVSVIKLYMGKPIVFEKNLFWYYEFKKGKYRVRMRLKIKYPDHNEKYIYSNWLYFNVIKSGIEFSEMN